jgi:hypothetical protein
MQHECEIAFPTKKLYFETLSTTNRQKMKIPYFKSPTHSGTQLRFFMIPSFLELLKLPYFQLRA